MIQYTRQPSVPANRSDAVYDMLKRAIINMELYPGTAMSEQEISSRMNVSRTPVREAFIKLSKERLVDIMPQKGTMVSKINLDDVVQEHFLRESLELALLPRLIQRYTSDDLYKLKELLILQKNAAEAKRSADFIDCDDAFHSVLFAAAHKEICWGVIDNTCGNLRRLRLMATWINGISTSIISEHQALLDAVMAHDVELAQAILKKHLYAVKDNTEVLTQQYPECFVTEENPFAINRDFLQGFYK